MNLNVSGIYQIRNIINGKIYVGQSKNIRKRIYTHKCLSGRCYHFYNAIKKYGWESFEVSILELIDDVSKLTEREQYWLDVLSAYNPEVGYNIRHIAESNKGLQFSSEHNAKIAASNTGKKHSDEAKAKMSAARKGIKFSDETREKIRIANTGKKLSEEHKAKIRASCKNISDETRARMTIANKNRSVESRAKMSAARIGKIFSDETKNKIKIALTGKKLSEEHRANMRAASLKIKVNQLNINGKIIRTWDSMSEAGDALLINSGNISLCCRNKRKSAGGYVWQFAEINQ